MDSNTIAKYNSTLKLIRICKLLLGSISEDDARELKIILEAEFNHGKGPNSALERKVLAGLIAFENVNEARKYIAELLEDWERRSYPTAVSKT